MSQLKFTSTDEGIRLLLALIKKYMFSFVITCHQHLYVTP